MNNNETVRVVVLHGHCLLREALIDRLVGEDCIDVCAVVENLDDLWQAIEAYNPQVLLMNVSLKCSEGVSSVKQLKRSFQDISIVAYSCDLEFEDSFVEIVLRAGANGYVSAKDSVKDLIVAIRAAGHKKPCLSEWARTRYQEHLAHECAIAYLSARESEVFFLTGCGYSTQRVAEKIGINIKTVETYKERIRDKMSLSGADLQYLATSFMRSIARGRVEKPEEEIVKELLSAID